MTHQYQIQGMTCDNCRQKVESTLSKVIGISNAEVSLEPPEAKLTMEDHIPMESLNKALLRVADYKLLEADHHDSPVSIPEKSVKTYKPLIVVVGFILLATAISQINRGAFDWMDAMRVFMGSFFLAFSFFKILDVKGFTQAYMSYDIIAKRWIGWGYIYPFIELALGVAYLTACCLTTTYIATLVVMGVSTIGVVQSVVNKREIKCACLGTGFNLPMSTVTIVEDVTMVVMAAVMLYVQ